MNEHEYHRLKQLCFHEMKAKEAGYQSIAGVDEAGRGPLAGPVVAAACLLPEGLLVEGVDDSKKLSPQQRKHLYTVLTENPRVIYAICAIDAGVIDQINILRATIQAMLQAVENLRVKPDYLLVDGLKLDHPVIPSQKIIKGDSLSQSIAAASILAKVFRDGLMEEYDRQWPEYGFKRHKGYGTSEHLAAIDRLGPCPIHRLSFAPLKSANASR